ncbi:MAG: phosphate acetyltransferase [Clostridia bacterium]|nr:phosphate acetyltransferase [Clostridia bacterium]
MSKLMNNIINTAKTLYKHIVLAEGEEQRIIDAAKMIAAEKIAKLTLLGDKDKIKAMLGGEIEGVNIVNPELSSKKEQYAELLYILRKEKGMTPQKAAELVKNPMYYGSLMVKASDADGLVAGSIYPTSELLRPALQIIKARPGIKTVSSCFVMCLPEGSAYGDEGVMVFGDCAVLPNPTAEQLADIAEASADSARKIAGIKTPKVALLSFSTKGSAKHELVDKVSTAVKILTDRKPDFIFDGELQLDAAIVPKVATLKAYGSPVGGNANVLIFPDLQAGNIGYKLTQRLGNALAIGPICQGMAKPVNDLSRGCSADDVVGVVAITSLQAGL